MAVRQGAEVLEPKGRLGVLLVGLGAVSTTFIAGVEAVKKGIGQPIGSLTQMGTVRLGKRTDNRVPLIKDFVPLAKLEDLVFGAWDIFEDSAYEAAVHAGVLEKELLKQLKTPLQKIKPMKAVFDQNYVKRLNGTNVKSGANKFKLAEQLIKEIAE
jgi:myo-inositol-1-phosphate synthase